MIKPELICPAGTPAALRSAVDAGADAVYCGYQNATNARNFVGLNFTPDEMEKSIKYAHDGGTKVLITLNTFPPAGNVQLWKDAADLSARLGADACIVADIAVAAYIQKNHPQMRIHLSVQAAASSPEAIRYYVQEFGVKRVVLPRIMTISEIKGLVEEIPCEVETFIFGNHGLMVEGRCSLTNYVTGQSTNMDGACSPASCVKYERAEDGSMSTILGDYMIDRFKPDETAGYPTICKGRYKCDARDDGYYAFEEPISLNASTMLPDLINAGVHAFKIEGRQRSRAYVKKVVAAFREAVDSIMAGQEPKLADLVALTEGQKHTEGALKTKKWR
ncbi:U32 family peptidase [Rhodovulum sp. BSW8]|uniref:U32 family peptidase n=1 Tax=Rhodovulum visakhapatnamense TaxID=364297 RepID=A0ABS1RD65_9RHOB|nr:MULTISPECIES: peptidase U32 family protein [Rhodovulum]MBL3569234.1 U32 family peptidase [Rhodovulum visakhapatnamense]MBL3577460.1 U32 family peptidase [Rhodovulum visakhapatnamense]OLS44038.1 protease [Rhodovulum sulfidophilum]RBO51365.1 U32 family peptidase [Rhodovulum sp. BSW8]